MSLVRIETCTTAIEAHILKGRLLADGIPAFIEFEHLLYLRWDYANLFGGVRVSVPSVCADEAFAVLRRLRTTTMYEMALESEIGPVPHDTCPKCHSENVTNERIMANLALFIAFSIRVPVPYSHHTNRCGSCSTRWSTADMRSPPLFVRATIILLLGIAFASAIELGQLWFGEMNN
jgi:hypothetical protein